MHSLFEMVESREVLARMPGDEDVYVDVTTKRGMRYLRVCLS